MRFAALAFALCLVSGSVEAAPVRPVNAAIVRVKAGKAKKNKTNVHKAPKRKPRNRVVRAR